jgi:hypothetical protein
MGGSLDPDALHLDPADPQCKPGKPKAWRRFYVQVPWFWVERLQSARRISTYKLALLLLYESWRGGGRPIVLSNALTAAEGLTPRAKWRALAELERLKLIEVQRHQGRSPRLIVRHLGSPQT